MPLRMNAERRKHGVSPLLLKELTPLLDFPGSIIVRTVHREEPAMAMLVHVLAASAILALSALPAAAQYPAKPIRYIVSYTPGGGADMLARAVGQKLSEAWGQQVLVENRPGAGTNIGSEVAAKSSPDGYTLFMPTVANAINPTLYPRLNYDLM